MTNFFLARQHLSEYKSTFLPFQERADHFIFIYFKCLRGKNSSPKCMRGNGTRCQGYRIEFQIERDLHFEPIQQAVHQGGNIQSSELFKK